MISIVSDRDSRKVVPCIFAVLHPVMGYTRTLEQNMITTPAKQNMHNGTCSCIDIKLK
jgi:hypothetical protein